MTALSERRQAELAVIQRAREFAVHYQESLTAPGAICRALVQTMRTLDELPLEEPRKVSASAISPETSWEAARSMRGHVKGKADEILSALLLCWQRTGTGLTTEQLCQRLSGKHQTISARVNELRDKGWIEPKGTRPTTSGRQASVWIPSGPVRTAGIRG